MINSKFRQRQKNYEEKINYSFLKPMSEKFGELQYGHIIRSIKA